MLDIKRSSQAFAKPSTLMVQGCTSDAGKSTLVAALARIFANRGLKVAPFKPQNMALNSAVTLEGGEIGRAQALQAQAAGINATNDMNPVLIKPSSDTGAQIIIQGKALGNMDAQSYHRYKPIAKAAVFESYQRLNEHYPIIVVEGAGSPAEINLREGDIANMGFAEEIDCPVIIVADIDKGGVFAHLVGTLALLSSSEQARVIGFVINKFRGDIALLEPGLKWLEEKTQKPVLGVLPYLHDLMIDAEDAIDQQQHAGQFKICVAVLPHISNHTDFDPLRAHPQVDLQFIAITQPPPPCDLLILPGSKNVIDDANCLHQGPWPAAIAKHLRYGGKLIGICGGLQLLGKHIYDPLSIEGQQKQQAGLGLLEIETTLAAEKTLVQKQGSLELSGKSAYISGYEIHHGITKFSSPNKTDKSTCNHILKYKDNSQDGYLSDDHLVFGCYLHGLFEAPAALESLLTWAGLEKPQDQNFNTLRESQIERLASSTEQHLDIDFLLKQLNAEARCSR